MSKGGGARTKPFDFLGFGALCVFIGAFQLCLDRGPSLDWFSSNEIWTETVVGIVAFWVFLIQTLTARHPFFDRSLPLDRNFVTCTVFGFFIGILLFSTMALLPTMMQQLMGYTALESGMASMPRGIGSFVAMFAVGRLIGKVDTRLILCTGLCVSTLSLWQMTHFDLSMTSWPIIVAGIIQGVGIGLIFVPLSTLAFTTIMPSLRAEATGVYTLMRSLGSSVGISIMEALLTANTAVVHSTMASRIDPSDPTVRASLGAMFNPGTSNGLQALNAEVTRQASMVAYLDDFKLMMVITIACLPLLLLMRSSRRAPETTHAIMD
jgi:DHA2 family multidrug resistance protein